MSKDKEAFEDIYYFKVKDYSTILLGQKCVNKNPFAPGKGFFIERGDGTKYFYEDFRVEWSKKYKNKKIEQLKADITRKDEALKDVYKFLQRLPSEWFSERVFAMVEQEVDK